MACGGCGHKYQWPPPAPPAGSAPVVQELPQARKWGGSGWGKATVVPDYTPDVIPASPELNRGDPIPVKKEG